jgi:hypothetical protein
VTELEANKITVGVVNWHCSAMIGDLFENLMERAEDDSLRFLICDNTNGGDKSLYRVFGDRCDIIPTEPVLPAILRHRRIGAASHAHGAGLNLLLSRLTTEYALFTDPDCLVLARGWDAACRASLSGPCIATGAPYHSSKLAKYHNFPSPIFVFFKTQAMRQLRADWTPLFRPLLAEAGDRARRAAAVLFERLGEATRGKRFYAGPTAAALRNLLGGSSKDTGCKLAAAASDRALDVDLLTPAVSARQIAEKYAGEKSIVELMASFELYLRGGIPFLTHYYGTAHRGRGDVTETHRRWKDLAEKVAEISPDWREERRERA